MFSEPFLEVFKLSTTIVVNGVLLVTLGVELESRVPSDFKTIDFVGSCVEFTNGKVGDILEFVGEFIPDWGELFAVTAPWSIVLNEDIIIAFKNNLVEVLSDDNLKWLAGIEWDLLTLKERLELLVLEVFDELFKAFNSE